MKWMTKLRLINWIACTAKPYRFRRRWRPPKTLGEPGKTNITQADNVFANLVKLRSDYKERYGFSGDIMSENNEDY